MLVLGCIEFRLDVVLVGRLLENGGGFIVGGVSVFSEFGGSWVGIGFGVFFVFFVGWVRGVVCLLFLVRGVSGGFDVLENDVLVVMIVFGVGWV